MKETEFKMLKEIVKKESSPYAVVVVRCPLRGAVGPFPGVAIIPMAESTARAKYDWTVEVANAPLMSVEDVDSLATEGQLKPDLAAIAKGLLLSGLSTAVMVEDGRELYMNIRGLWWDYGGRKNE